MRIAVVGAGLAGLAAADEARRAGAEVVVLEARDRVGGRVWSRRLENGAVVEMGAEFILPGNTAVRELVSRFGLGLWDKGMRYGRREPRGGPAVTPAELDEAVRVAGRAMDEAPVEMSAARFLDGLDIAAGAREVILARTEISSANSAELVSARDLGGIAHIDDDPAPSIAGGNQRLPQALAGSLGPALRLRSPVERVAWDDRGARVRAAGAELVVDACVVAVPASVLERIHFEPQLPEPLASALGQVAYGHAAKLFVPLRRPAPAGAVMAVPERYWTWTATGPDQERAQPVVSAFAGSAGALEGLAVESGPKRWLASVERLRGDLALDPSGALLSTWADDPWVRAAYSTSPPAELAELAATPAGPLAFAGEHLGGAHAALMEGAIRSGRRAAASVLRAGAAA
jgi:monoamine oxidase